MLVDITLKDMQKRVEAWAIRDGILNITHATEVTHTQSSFVRIWTVTSRDARQVCVEDQDLLRIKASLDEAARRVHELEAELAAEERVRDLEAHSVASLLDACVSSNGSSPCNKKAPPTKKTLDPGKSVRECLGLTIDANPSPRERKRLIKCWNGGAVNETHRTACNGMPDGVSLPEGLSEKNWVAGWAVLSCKLPKGQSGGHAGVDFANFRKVARVVNEWTGEYKPNEWYQYKDGNSSFRALVSTPAANALLRVAIRCICRIHPRVRCAQCSSYVHRPRDGRSSLRPSRKCAVVPWTNSRRISLSFPRATCYTNFWTPFVTCCATPT